MAEGYFDDGSVALNLGAHVFGLPAVRRRNLRFDPADAASNILDSGGGVIQVDLRAQRLRDSLGDAEQYAYQLLRSLALSDAGDLAYEDNAGNRHVYGDALFSDGTAEILAFRFVDMHLSFVVPEKDSEPAWDAVPAAPGTYAGSTTAQDYTAGGVTLGIGARMKVETLRVAELREIPRARGARATVPTRGAHARFTISGARIAVAESLATDIEDLVRSIGPRPVDLVANGHTYADVLLESVRPDDTDRRHTSLVFEFVKEL